MTGDEKRVLELAERVGFHVMHEDEEGVHIMEVYPLHMFQMLIDFYRLAQSDLLDSGGK